MMSMMTIIYVDYIVDNDNWWYHDIEFDDHSYKSAEETMKFSFCMEAVCEGIGVKEKNASESQVYIPLNLLNWNFWGRLKPIQIGTWSPKK